MTRRSAPLLWLLLAALPMLGGCGQLPKPFQPEAKPNVIASLTRQATIRVVPPQGDGEAQSVPADPSAATAAIAEALGSQGLLTTTEETQTPTRRLVSIIAVDPQEDPQSLHSRVTIDWTLYEYEGSVLGRYRQEIDVLKAGWRLGVPGIYDDIAQDAAPRIAAFLERQGPEEVRLPGRPGASLHVLPVEGAPGNGNAALTREIVRYLKLDDLPVSNQPGERDLLVSGSVAITPQDDGTDLVEVMWQLLEPDGRELGIVDQANKVPAGSLNRSWDAAAPAIAQAAVPGIRDLLARSN